MPNTTRARTESRAAKPIETVRPRAAQTDHAPRSNHSMQSIVAPVVGAPGRPLEPAVRAEMEHGLGRPLGDVRVHTDAAAATAAQAAGAEAFTAGSHVAFRSGRYAPETTAGRKLIAHELTHVVQQSAPGGGMSPSLDTTTLESRAEQAATDVVRGRTARVGPTAGAPALQFRIAPEQVSSEMVGTTFVITKSFVAGAVSLAPGDRVEVVAWDVDREHRVRVKLLGGKAAGTVVVVPETVMRPETASAKGVVRYGTGIAGESAAVEKAETELAAWESGKASFKSAKAKALFTREEARRTDVLAARRRVLNRKQIQEAMFNRFDVVIEREVRDANAAHGLKGTDALDPNLVKAQLFQESQFGTSGEHLEETPSHPVRSRFNVGQVIDSSGIALLTLFEKEQPELLKKFSLEHLRRDLVAAQQRLHALESRKKKTKLSSAEATELASLLTLAGKARNWEPFIWGYMPTGTTVGFSAAVDEFFKSSTPPRNLDYDFWIHMAVFWLFEKKRKGQTWADTIKAYNGSGAPAEHYKLAVVSRAAKAAATSAAGDEFVPGGI